MTVLSINHKPIPNPKADGGQIATGIVMHQLSPLFISRSESDTKSRGANGALDKHKAPQ